MKDGKASGNDDITTEMLKALDDTGVQKITELCNLIYDTSYIPREMNESIFVRLPKKAKATSCSDFRTLSSYTESTTESYFIEKQRKN